MRFWKPITILVMTVSLPLSAAVPLKPPIDPAPIGHGVDPGMPIDLLELENSMLAVFAVPRGGGKFQRLETFVRPLDSQGQPFTASQKFVSMRLYEAAASNGDEVAVVWLGDGIQVALLDAMGNQVLGPVKVAEREPAKPFGSGVMDLYIEPDVNGWTVAWNFRKRISEPQRRDIPMVEAVSVGRDLHVLSEPWQSLENSTIQATTNLPTGPIAVVDSPAGVEIHRMKAGELIPAVQLSDAGSGVAAAWNGQQLGVVLTTGETGGSLRLVILSSTLELQHVGEIPRTERCDTVSIGWTGLDWRLVCSTSWPKTTEIYVLSSTGMSLGSHLIEGVRIFDTLYAFDELWLLSGDGPRFFGSDEPVVLHRLDGDDLTRQAILSTRAANTTPLAMTRWGSDWMFIFLQENNLMAAFLTRSGSLLAEPIDLSTEASSSFLIPAASVAIAEDDDEVIIVTGDAADPSALLILRLKQTSGIHPLVERHHLQLEEPASVFDATIGDSGLLIYYQSEPYGRRIHNLVLLNQQMEPVAERKFGSTFPGIYGITAVGPNFFLGLAWEGFGIELLDPQLETLAPRTSVIPRAMNPSQPVMSANDDHLLISWINSNDHVRTVVLDADGEVVGGEGDGTVVALGGEYDEKLTVTPAGQGWWLSWLSSDSEQCDETTYIHRIRVDSLGQLITPFPHDPLYQLDTSCDAARLAPDGSAVIKHLRRYDIPYGGALRALLQFAPTRLRGVSRP